MLQEFAREIQRLQAQKPRVPLAYLTEREKHDGDDIEECIAWCRQMDAYLRERRRLRTRAIHTRRCREDALRRHNARQAALAEAAESPGWHDPDAPRPGHGGLRIGRVIVTDAGTGAYVRTGLIDFEHGGIEVSLQALDGPQERRNPPRYIQSFPKLAAPVQEPTDQRQESFSAPLRDSLREWEGCSPLPDALAIEHPEELVAKLREPEQWAEPRGKERLADDDAVSWHQPDEGCPTCGRGPALCTCPIEVAEEELDYAGFTSDVADRYIALTGRRVELAGRIADIGASIPAGKAELRRLEAHRHAPGSADDRERLKAIAAVAIALDKAPRLLWGLARQLEDLDAEIALLEELEDPTERDFAALEAA